MPEVASVKGAIQVVQLFLFEQTEQPLAQAKQFFRVELQYVALVHVRQSVPAAFI